MIGNYIDHPTKKEENNLPRREKTLKCAILRVGVGQSPIILEPRMPCMQQLLEKIRDEPKVNRLASCRCQSGLEKLSTYTAE